jgi:hypothetical protein
MLNPSIKRDALKRAPYVKRWATQDRVSSRIAPIERPQMHRATVRIGSPPRSLEGHRLMRVPSQVHGSFHEHAEEKARNGVCVIGGAPEGPLIVRVVRTCSSSALTSTDENAREPGTPRKARTAKKAMCVGAAPEGAEMSQRLANRPFPTRSCAGRPLSPNPAVNRTAQQLRCWVRSALARSAGRLPLR